jgi:hypothetical protein
VYELFLATHFAGGAFQIIGIPEDAVIDTPQYEFTPELSATLYDLGRSMALRGAWQTEPPRFDSLTTQIRLDDIRDRMRQSAR